MKKILFVLLLLFPFMVKAVENVKITDIEQLEKSDSVVVKTEPTFEGLKLNFDFKFVNLNDYVKYKVTVKNEDTKEYELEAGVAFSEGEYIKYEFGLNGESNTIKPNETKEMTLQITYVKEPDPSLFADGGYTETNSMSINLSYDNGQHNSVDPANQANPKTGAQNVLIFITILLISGVMLTVALRKNDKVLMALALLLIPISALALEKITLQIDTKIELERTEKTFKFIDYHCGFGEPTEYEIEYMNGMTWGQFLASEYYTQASTKYADIENIDFFYNRILSSSSLFYIEEPQCYKDLQEPNIPDDMPYEEEEALWDAYYEARNKCQAKYKTSEFNDNDYIISESVAVYKTPTSCPN